jgi:hypothetical protein
MVKYPKDTKALVLAKRKKILHKIIILAFITLIAVGVASWYASHLPQVLYSINPSSGGFVLSGHDCTEFNHTLKGSATTPLVIGVSVSNYSEVKDYLEYKASLVNNEKYFKKISYKNTDLGTIQPVDEFIIYFKVCKIKEANNLSMNRRLLISVHPSKWWGYGGVMLIAIFMAVFTFLFQAYQFVRKLD